VGLVGVQMMPGRASSHREAPLISKDPGADNTDVYAWRTAGDTVTLISNFIPLEKPDAGPNFYEFDPNVVYAIHIDNNGDAVEDITYEWVFTTEVRSPNTFLYATGQVTSTQDPDLNRRQFYNLTRIDGPRRTGNRTLIAGRLPVAPANVGPRTTPNYGGMAFSGSVQGVLNGNALVFAGPRDEGFYVDLAVFDLLGVGSGAVEGSTDGLNVHSIALRTSIARLTRNNAIPSGPGDPNGIIGVWSTASRYTTRTLAAGGETHSGALVQVSRLGNPLVNEVVIDLARKDAFNGLEPTGDAAALDRVTTSELAGLLNAVFGIAVPPSPRNDLVTIFLTGIAGLNQPPNVRPSEMLRLNTGVPPSTSPSTLGLLGGDIAGFPNGRRVGDDVFDIAVRAVAGGTPLTPPFNVAPNNRLGDGVDKNDVPYLTDFPYLAHPHAGNK
jgi:hypothetical protein